MRAWSAFFQNSEHLIATRLMLLNSDNKRLLRQWLKLKDGMTILDVGCANGFLTMELFAELKDCRIIGLDIDESFISLANERLVDHEIGQQNDVQFMTGDGYRLPFEEYSFDLVFSHAYLTSVQDVNRAFSEMVRVTKEGGLLSSVTTQSFMNNPFGQGTYTVEYMDLVNELQMYSQKLTRAIISLNKKEEFFLNEKVVTKIPSIFAQFPLKNIEMHSLGIAYSLSNSAIPNEEKARYIENFIESQIKTSEYYFECYGENEYFTGEDNSAYRELLHRQKRYLLDNIGENDVWEWTGGASICMQGTKQFS